MNMAVLIRFEFTVAEIITENRKIKEKGCITIVLRSLIFKSYKLIYAHCHKNVFLFKL